MGFLLIIAIVIIGYFLFRPSKENVEKQKNQRALVEEIASLAVKEGSYYYISSMFGSGGKYASAHIHYCTGEVLRFGFNEHGYEYLTEQGMRDLFKALERRLNGHLHYDTVKKYSSMGGSGVSSYSVSFAPGGGVGITGNSDCYAGDYDKVIGIVVYSADEWNRLEALKKSSKGSTYKKSF